MEEILKAAKKTAEYFAECLFPQNRMNWLGDREDFVSSFVEEFAENYFKITNK